MTRTAPTISLASTSFPLMIAEGCADEKKMPCNFGSPGLEFAAAGFVGGGALAVTGVEADAVSGAGALLEIAGETD